MASKSNESDEKLRGSVTRFAQTWRAYKKSQSRQRSQSQTPRQSPSSSSSSSGGAWGYPPGPPSGSVAASAARYRLASSKGPESPSPSSLWYQVASVRSRRGNPPPKSRLSVSSGGGGRDEAPGPSEYGPPRPSQASNYYGRSSKNYSSKIDRVDHGNKNCIVM